MLETLISSKIRRALFEHLLTHPRDRFYLRGLAKELHLSISPLRRELKRFEQNGLLTTIQEANIRFYIVNENAPELRQIVSLQTSAPGSFGSRLEAPGSRQKPLPSPSAFTLQPRALSPVASSLQPSVPAPSAVPASPPTLIPVGIIPPPAGRPQASSLRELGRQSRPPTGGGIISAKPRHSFWSAPLPNPLLVAIACVGVAFLLIVGALLTMRIDDARKVAAHLHLKVEQGKATIAVATPLAPSSSGIMHGSRWQIVPGTFGGFSSGSSDSHSRAESL